DLRLRARRRGAGPVRADPDRALGGHREGHGRSGLPAQAQPALRLVRSPGAMPGVRRHSATIPRGRPGTPGRAPTRPHPRVVGDNPESGWVPSPIRKSASATTVGGRPRPGTDPTMSRPAGCLPGRTRKRLGGPVAVEEARTGVAARADGVWKAYGS